MNKILLVGELNPYGADPAFALYPLPAHASGARLMAILGLSLRQYLKEHDRVNLCTGAWAVGNARMMAAQILAERPPNTGVVLCGSKVSYAFDVRYGGPFQQVITGRGLRLLSIPHPSGLNRMWNVPEVAEGVRAAYRQLVADVDVDSAVTP